MSYFHPFSDDSLYAGVYFGMCHDAVFFIEYSCEWVACDPSDADRSGPQIFLSALPVMVLRPALIFLLVLRNLV